MSEQPPAETTERIDRDANFPRAVIHKRILSVANSKPDASMEELADEVSGATTDIVEQVLDEYGDPAVSDAEQAGTHSETEADDSTASADDDRVADQADSVAEEGIESPTDGPGSGDRAGSIIDSLPDPADVTEKQLETLREIRARPDATQAELGDVFGVSGATINQRVNGIEGFDWAEREAFVDRFFAYAGASATPMEPEPAASAAGTQWSDSGDPTRAHGASSAAMHPDGTVRGDGGQPPRDTGDRAGRTEMGARGDVRTSSDGDVTGDGDVAAQLATLTDQLATLAARLDTLERRYGTDRPACADPTLVHKVVHACMASDRITEDEELRILESILGSEPE
ncbi:MarR family transcriptional regulator [Natrialbaceae archaeon GCM10025810]|uniref:MarR family transcriptional regulator n=1 Tax=Halovalidus salilacus TaxID=3075124 RepID=UPI003607AF09